MASLRDEEGEKKGHERVLMKGEESKKVKKKGRRGEGK